jgi:hypothetical protein
MNSRFTKTATRTILSSALLMFLSNAQVLADDTKSALDVRGYVTSYQHGKGGAHIDRVGSKKPIPIRIGTNLVVGDILSLDQGAQVKIELSDGPVTLDEANTPFEIKSGRPIPGVVSSLYQRFKFAMDNLFNKMPPSFGHSESKGSGGCPPEPAAQTLRPVVALASPVQRIPAATETLSAAWAGGVPPFVIHLEGAGLPPSSGSQCSRAIDGWPLATTGPKSSATLTITDAKHATITWTLQFEHDKGSAAEPNSPSEDEELEAGALSLVDKDPSLHMAGFTALTDVSSTYFFALRLTQAVKNDEPFQ